MATTNALIKALPEELKAIRPAGGYSFEEYYRMAQVFHASGLFEDVTDAAIAMVKIMRGQELGLPPTTAMNAIDIIRKRMFLKPWAIAAKINACGYGGYHVTEQTPDRCTIQFVRKMPGRGWVDCPPVTFTFAEAKAHGLVDRSPHWKASPAHMLYQRAMGRGGAMYFPELLAGLEVAPDTSPVEDAEAQAAIADLFGDAAPAVVDHAPVTWGRPADDWREALWVSILKLPDNHPERSGFVALYKDEGMRAEAGAEAVRRCNEALARVQAEAAAAQAAAQAELDEADAEAEKGGLFS